MPPRRHSPRERIVRDLNESMQLTMHLKQFKWNTVPKARTKGPCITFPHEEQALGGLNTRCKQKVTYAAGRDCECFGPFEDEEVNESNEALRLAGSSSM